jgi:hypothetical protein
LKGAVTCWKDNSKYPKVKAVLKPFHPWFFPRVVIIKCRMSGLKKKKARALRIKISFFSSFEEENRADYARLRRMTPNQRLDEFAILQERAFGPNWTKNQSKKLPRLKRLNGRRFSCSSLRT